MHYGGASHFSRQRIVTTIALFGGPTRAANPPPPGVGNDALSSPRLKTVNAHELRVHHTFAYPRSAVLSDTTAGDAPKASTPREPQARRRTSITTGPVHGTTALEGGGLPRIGVINPTPNVSHCDAGGGGGGGPSLVVGSGANPTFALLASFVEQLAQAFTEEYCFSHRSPLHGTTTAPAALTSPRAAASVASDLSFGSAAAMTPQSMRKKASAATVRAVLAYRALTTMWQQGDAAAAERLLIAIPDEEFRAFMGDQLGLASDAVSPSDTSRIEFYAKRRSDDHASSSATPADAVEEPVTLDFRRASQARRLLWISIHQSQLDPWAAKQCRGTPCPAPPAGPEQWVDRPDMYSVDSPSSSLNITTGSPPRHQVPAEALTLSSSVAGGIAQLQAVAATNVGGQYVSFREYLDAFRRNSKRLVASSAKAPAASSPTTVEPAAAGSDSTETEFKVLRDDRCLVGALLSADSLVPMTLCVRLLPRLVYTFDIHAMPLVDAERQEGTAASGGTLVLDKRGAAADIRNSVLAFAAQQVSDTTSHEAKQLPSDAVRLRYYFFPTLDARAAMYDDLSQRCLEALCDQKGPLDPNSAAQPENVERLRLHEALTTRRRGQGTPQASFATHGVEFYAVFPAKSTTEAPGLLKLSGESDMAHVLARVPATVDRNTGHEEETGTASSSSLMATRGNPAGSRAMHIVVRVMPDHPANQPASRGASEAASQPAITFCFYGPEHEQAAVKVQCFYRKQTAISLTKERRDIRAAMFQKEVKESLKETAAVSIQSAFRGSKTRRTSVEASTEVLPPRKAPVPSGHTNLQATTKSPHESLCSSKKSSVSSHGLSTGYFPRVDGTAAASSAESSNDDLAAAASTGEQASGSYLGSVRVDASVRTAFAMNSIVVVSCPESDDEVAAENASVSLQSPSDTTKTSTKQGRERERGASSRTGPAVVAPLLMQTAATVIQSLVRRFLAARRRAKRLRAQRATVREHAAGFAKVQLDTPTIGVIREPATVPSMQSAESPETPLTLAAPRPTTTVYVFRSRPQGQSLGICCQEGVADEKQLKRQHRGGGPALLFYGLRLLHEVVLLEKECRPNARGLNAFVPCFAWQGGLPSSVAPKVRNAKTGPTMNPTPAPRGTTAEGPLVPTAMSLPKAHQLLHTHANGALNKGVLDRIIEAEANDLTEVNQRCRGRELRREEERHVQRTGQGAPPPQSGSGTPGLEASAVAVVGESGRERRRKLPAIPGASLPNGPSLQTSSGTNSRAKASASRVTSNGDGERSKSETRADPINTLRPVAPHSAVVTSAPLLASGVAANQPILGAWMRATGTVVGDPATSGMPHAATKKKKNLSIETTGSARNSTTKAPLSPTAPLPLGIPGGAGGGTVRKWMLQSGGGGPSPSQAVTGLRRVPDDDDLAYIPKALLAAASGDHNMAVDGTMGSAADASQLHAAQQLATALLKRGMRDVDRSSPSMPAAQAIADAQEEYLRQQQREYIKRIIKRHNARHPLF